VRCTSSADPEDALQLLDEGSLQATEIFGRDILSVRTKLLIAVAAAAGAGDADEFALAAARAEAAGIAHEEIGALVWELADQGILVSSHILRFAAS
jgi:alkylhydroperoxidase/carboxymuconolactone decarboxylase family protein YurZ